MRRWTRSSVQECRFAFNRVHNRRNPLTLFEPMFLTRIKLTNVRCIRSLTLPLGMSSGITRKWTLLLGDNGVGKSTLMRSIGLVLAGSSALAELIGDPGSWVHVGEDQCTISADLETADGEKRQISLN